MTILQDRFDGETPSDAEKRWIMHYWEELGDDLVNVVHTTKPRPSTPLTFTLGERATLSIRNVHLEKWSAVKALAKDEGKMLWVALDEALDCYLAAKKPKAKKGAK